MDVLYDYDDPGIEYEAIVTSGDSGAPTFVPYRGSLALIGTHWYYYTVSEDDPTPLGSGDPFLPNYIADINAAMVGESLTEVRRLRDSEDYAEGPRAFAEKRSPRWTGR